MDREEQKKFYVECIYSLHMDVYRIIKSVIGNADTTEELTQIVLEKAWRSIGTLRDKTKAKEWLKAITRNVLRGHFRKEKTESGSWSNEDPSAVIHKDGGLSGTGSTVGGSGEGSAESGSGSGQLPGRTRSGGDLEAFDTGDPAEGYRPGEGFAAGKYAKDLCA